MKYFRVAFIVDEFPAPTETFIINQVADLIDHGVEVEVFALRPGPTTGISRRYHHYQMAQITHYLNLPAPYFLMLALAIPRLLRILYFRPAFLWRLRRLAAADPDMYASKAVFLVAPFVGRRFDLFHCHFGTVANRYLPVRRALCHTEPLVTTFYGYDVSQVITKSSPQFYDDLKIECSLFFVMSNNMRERVMRLGFDPSKVVVLPAGVDVRSYAFKERKLSNDEPIKITAVGRLVAKKGFDDLVRAIEIVTRSTSQPFHVSIVGDGAQEAELKAMVRSYGVENHIEFTGHVPVEKVVDLLLETHLLVQPSKTAPDGDME